MYELAAEKIGLTAEGCAVFEDIYAGVKGAKLGGFYTIGVEDKYAAHEREQIKKEADLYIKDYKELLK